MCEKLSEIREALKSYASGFDARVLTAEQASLVVEAAATVENMAATLKALAAARVAECGAWKRSGARSAAHHLARSTGSSLAQATEALDTARRLGELPAVSAAARAGQLSASQTAAVADAAAAAPGSEASLLERAAVVPLGELRNECGRLKAAAGTDREERRRRIHAGRYLRSYTDTEGAWHLHMRHNPEVGAQVMAALEPIRDRLFRGARAERRREHPQAYAADALVEAVVAGPEAKASTSGTTKVLVRVDLSALLGGHPTDGEVCDIAGYGPVAVSAIHDLIDTGDPFLAAVVTKGEAVVGVAHLGRRPNARQQSALQWLYPDCTNEACGAVARLEFDHRAIGLTPTSPSSTCSIGCAATTTT